MPQGFLDMLAPGVAVVEGEEVVGMGQGMVQSGALARALDMVKQVGPMELMLVEAEAVEKVEGVKMEDLGMGLAQVLATGRLGDMGLVEDHMLREEVKVEVAVVDKMRVLDQVPARA
jgi:hypothetical protein